MKAPPLQGNNCLITYRSEIHDNFLTDEPDAPSQDEQAVERARLHVGLRLLLGEAARVAEEVNEGDGDAPVYVQDEVRLLAGGDALHLEGVVLNKKE